MNTGIGILNGQIGIVNAGIGIVNTRIGIVNRRLGHREHAVPARRAQAAADARVFLTLRGQCGRP